MNHTYHHRKGPPKLVKDLKHGTAAHLRQSLLDISEIQNLNKIFVGRKTHYKIDESKNQSPSKKKQKTQNEEKDQDQFSTDQFVLSPQENLLLIKKQRITNKMKDKLNQMFKPQQIRKFKLRKPVLHNMLQDFKSSFRVQEQLKFRQALKESEKNLQHIKTNSKKRISSQYIHSDSAHSRTKFLSISTGMPVASKNCFPSFEDFLKGKHMVKEKPTVGIDIAKIDNYFNTMITEPMILPLNGEKKSFKDDFVRNFNRQVHSKTSVHRTKNSSPSGNYNDDPPAQAQTVKYFQVDKELVKMFQPSRSIRSKSAINPSINFKKSQDSSKKIISTMQNYYSVKKQKNQECDSIVEYMKKDRPLTSHLRRKNYQVIGKTRIDQVSKYRQKSENQRILIQDKNYDFYISLLRIFEHCKQEEIQTSLKILNRLKEFFESEYVLFQQDAQKICRLNKGEKIDFGVNTIRENLLEYAKKDDNMSTQNSEQFELL